MVTFKQLKKILKTKSYKNLDDWMRGQTCGVNEKGETVIYDSDLLRWLEGSPVID